MRWLKQLLIRRVRASLKKQQFCRFDEQQSM
jgi:hypothetical protein